MKSIKTKLVLSFTTIILAVTIIIGFISLQSGMNSLKKEAKTSLQILVTEGAKLTESRMSSFLSILNMVAMKQEIKNMGWEVNLSVLQEELQKTDFLDIGYVLPNGYVHYATGSVVLMSDRSYVKSALGGQARISDIIFSRVSNQPEIEICVPVVNDGEVVGALIAREKADFLSTITGDIGYGENGYAMIMKEDGTIIAHKDETKMTAIAIAFEYMNESNKGIIEYQEDGNSVYAGIAPINETNWKFVIVADKQEILEAIPEMVRNILTAMFLVFIISTIFVFILDHSLTKPLIEMTKLSERIAVLDVSLNIPDKYLKQKDEIGTLSRMFQKIMLNLREIIKELANSTNYISMTAQDLTSTSQQSAAVSEEITQTIEVIANSATNQASRTDDGLHQASILGNVIENNEKLIALLNSASNKVTSEVEEGLKEIDQLSTSSKLSEEATKEIGGIILSTSNSSNQIGEASKMISKMAKQINLLSLNASIEAARAGESGQGFAVVAEEILRLAKQSASSSNYIEEIISDLQENVEKAVESMKKMERASRDQHKSVMETINKYQSIASSMNISEEAVHSLNYSKNDMNLAKNEIGEMLDSLALIAKQNDLGTKQAAISMQEQSDFAQNIADASEKLASLAINLQELVMRFQV